MIPFKPKPNSILKNTAVLLILLCISDSCFSYIQDSRRTTEDSRRFTKDYQRQVVSKDQSRRSNTALQREAVEVSPYVRDVRADSRQSRIDARDIRTDFREIRTELRNLGNTRENRQETRYMRESRIVKEQRTPIVANRRDDSRQTMFRELSNNIIYQDSSRNAPDMRNIRENSREYPNYSRQRLQRQLSNRNSEDSSKERREFDAASQNARLVRERSEENRDRRQSDDSRQIRDRSLERMSEDRRVVREDSRDSRERFDNRRTTSRSVERRVEHTTSHIPREESRNLRHLQIRSDARRNFSPYSDERRFGRVSQDRRELQGHARQFRDVQEGSVDRRTLTLRFNDRQFERQARREVSELSRSSRDDRERSSNQRIREIDLERQDASRERHNDGPSAQRRNILQNLSRRQSDDNENFTRRQGNMRGLSNARENRDLSRERQGFQNIRQNNRRRVESSDIMQERQNNIELSQKSRIARHRLENSHQDARRHSENNSEWPRTLRVYSESISRQEERRERQPALRERREITREHPEARRVYSRQIHEDRKEFVRLRIPLLVDRRDESRTRHIIERRENSRTKSSQRADERRKASENIRYRRQFGREREDSERRERFIGERREIIPDTREFETKDRGTNSRKDLKDTRVITMADVRAGKIFLAKKNCFKKNPNCEMDIKNILPRKKL